MQRRGIKIGRAVTCPSSTGETRPGVVEELIGNHVVVVRVGNDLRTFDDRCLGF